MIVGIPGIRIIFWIMNVAMTLTASVISKDVPMWSVQGLCKQTIDFFRGGKSLKMILSVLCRRQCKRCIGSNASASLTTNAAVWDMIRERLGVVDGSGDVGRLRIEGDKKIEVCSFSLDLID